MSQFRVCITSFVNVCHGEIHEIFIKLDTALALPRNTGTNESWGHFIGKDTWLETATSLETTK